MLPDYHCHTRRCGHAAGEMEEYLDAARRKGLKEIGFADHIPMYWLPEEKQDAGLAMEEKELPAYVSQVNKLREENPDITVKLGIEADYIQGREEELKRILSLYPFDYVIGSVHYLNGWGFDNPSQMEEYSRWKIKEAYEAYFLTLQQAAQSGIFDIMAHPDLIKKFNYRLNGDLASWYDKTARVFAHSGVCVELNTAGLAAPAKEIYPALDFLKSCRKHKVPAATGSDAHLPDQVGRGWKEAIEYLKEAGYTEIATFSRRRRTMAPLGFL